MVSFGKTDFSFWRQVSWLHSTTSSRREVLVWDMVSTDADGGQDGCLNDKKIQKKKTQLVSHSKLLGVARCFAQQKQSDIHLGYCSH